MATDDRFRVTGLSLDKNRLTGGIPPELGEIDSLLNVDLSDNGLAGEIPAESGNAAKLGRLSNLMRLDLHSSRLTGEIPPELGNLTNLNGLHIQPGNGLTGCMPASFRQRRARYPGGPGRFAYFR